MSKTMVLIHGMMGAAWCWDNYKPFFETRGYRCVVPVLRYHDMDPREQPDPRLGTTGLLDYAADLEAEIRKLDEKPILVGHSMGGLLAQMLGARGLASALVLLTPAAPHGIFMLHYSVVKSFSGLLKRWKSWARPFRVTYTQAGYSIFHRLPEPERERLYNKLVYESGRAAFQIGMWFLDSAGTTKVDERKINCPVLVIGAGMDRVTPASTVRRVAAKYDKVSTYREYRDFSHWVIGDPGWEEIAAGVCDWLENRG